MSTVVASLALTRTEDVFALRQCGRSAAAAIGLEEPDQVRLATALSELGRQALAQPVGASATFRMEADGSIEVEIEGLSSGAPDLSSAIQAARRLVTDVVVTQSADGTRTGVRLARHPRRDSRPTPATVDAAIRASLSSGPLEDLRIQNHDLIAALDELRTRQEELLRVNEELEETNRGVLAMYSQLSDELEETNRGVVALYAELDDKTMQVKQASDSKSRFLASISHELRSPINSIVGLVRLLQDGVSESPSGEQHLQLGYIEESASRLLQLVDELLDLAKAEAGRLEPALGPVSLLDVFSELRGAIRPLVAPGVELIVQPPGTEFVDTDHALLVQVLRNLLSNAAKFTESGHIELRAEESADELTIAVKDTGIGIAPFEMERIFEDFYQVRGPLQHRHKGTGLGLGYSRKVAEALGGRVSVQSVAGQGSEFRISIPHHRGRHDDVGPAPSFGSALLVDDDPAFRHTMQRHLAGLCREIVEADGGRAALAEIDRCGPDVVFLDLSMPDMTGQEVLAALRSDPRYAALPVVVVTSATAEDVGAVPGASARVSKTGLDRAGVISALSAALRAARTVQ